MQDDKDTWVGEQGSDWPGWLDEAPAKRGRKKKPAIAVEAVVGRRNVRMLQRHLDGLRAATAHGNRVLHYDNLVMALLLAFYNPTCRSLRTIEGLSRVSKDVLGIERLCRSTTSDALAAFDPSLLLGVIQELRSSVPALGRADEDLDVIVQRVIAADGSYFNLYADVAWAIHLTRTNGRDAAQVRLNFQLDVRDLMPMHLSVSGREEGSEIAAVTEDLVEGVIYVCDRNFAAFSFITSILQKKSDFVIRCKEASPIAQVQVERELSERDRKDGVVSDRTVVLPGRNAPDGPLRELILEDPKTLDRIRVLTSLMEPPAYVIGVLYRRRWQIELFFRWLKVWGNFEHLLNHTKNGLTIHFYVAVIGVLLMYASTGHRVSKYAFSMLGFVASGKATLEDILPELELREREKQLERERLARKRAQKSAK